MGTSAPYDAPPNWGELKSEVTRLAREANLTSPQLRRLIQGVVRGNGGRNEMASGGRQGAAGSAGSAAPARDVARRFANFIADVRQNGFAAAAERAGLGDLSGKSVGDILNTLLDRLGGNASSIDDADARQALSDLQQELLADAKTFEEVQEILSTDALDLENLLERFFGHYIFEQFSRVFYERLVQRVGSSSIPQQILPTLSAAKRAVPDPRNGSMTTCPRDEQSSRASATIAIGFTVGCIARRFSSPRF
jgi:hypothetical protein